MKILKALFRKIVSTLISAIFVTLPLSLITGFILYNFIEVEFMKIFTITEAVLLNIYFPILLPYSFVKIN